MGSKHKDTQKDVSLITTITDADFGLWFTDFDTFAQYEIKIVFFHHNQKKILVSKKNDTYTLPYSEIQNIQIDENILVKQCQEKIKGDIQFFVPLGKIIEKKMKTNTEKTSFGYLFFLQDSEVISQKNIKRDNDETLMRVFLDDVINSIKEKIPQEYDAKFETKKDFHFLMLAKEHIKKREENMTVQEFKKQNEQDEKKQMSQEQTEDTKENSNEWKNSEIIRLQKQLEEIQAIASKAQYDYVTLKMDFDSYRNRMERQLTEWKIDILIDVVKKFLPFIESLRKSLLTLPEDFKQQPFGKWLQMMYENFLNSLATMSIVPIKTEIWAIPDVTFHEPVSIQTVDDTNLKGKIIMELEQWFVYKNWDVQKVIKTSKVIVWQ